MENLNCYQKNYRNCTCGSTFEELYFKKKINCLNCLKTFSHKFYLLINSKNINLEEIYSLEKESYRIYFSNFSPYNIKNFIKNYKNLENKNPLLRDISNLPFSEHFTYSIRLRYTRNVYGLPMDLSNNEILKLSHSIFSQQSFLFHELKRKFNMIFFECKDRNLQIYPNVYQGKMEFYDFTQGFVRIYVGEEDHFRMDVIIPLENFITEEEIPKLVEKILEVYKVFLYLDKIFQWEFHQILGFLTKGITNIGSGIRLYIRLYVQKEMIDYLNFFQRNSFFSRLKNYTIRGKNGENSMYEDFLTIGWDLPYVELKKFHSDLKKRLIVWFYQFSYTMLKKNDIKEKVIYF
ncbi:MAG: hypothetical protein ACK4UJ_02820 [Leptonema sp. (in: bacteria)]